MQYSSLNQLNFHIVYLSAICKRTTQTEYQVKVIVSKKGGAGEEAADDTVVR